MERSFFVCIMWQQEIGQVAYSDAVVTTDFGPFHPDFLQNIKKAVSEKRNAPLEKIVVISMARLD